MAATTERAILAGGCFWGMQQLVRRLPGVVSTRVGYSGGDVKNATYRNHGTHAEAIEITFDLSQTSFRDLLEFFFQIHDPTTPHRQGNDRGASYRSAIFYTSEQQRRVAEDTIGDVEEALAAKQVSAVEQAQGAIGGIERYDAKINAICVRDFDRALAAARAADAALAHGAQKPLLGIPMTVMESYSIAGLPTIWGIPEQQDFTPTEDALSIARVKDAGAVILGKTNVPPGLGDWKSDNGIYGTTNNPYDLTRAPGGSSGGSSVALAAGYGALSFSSDIGGSSRVPHFIAASMRTNRPTHWCRRAVTRRACHRCRSTAICR